MLSVSNSILAAHAHVAPTTAENRAVGLASVINDAHWQCALVSLFWQSIIPQCRISPFHPSSAQCWWMSAMPTNHWIQEAPTRTNRRHIGAVLQRKVQYNGRTRKGQWVLRACKPLLHHGAHHRMDLSPMFLGPSLFDKFEWKRRQGANTHSEHQNCEDTLNSAH